MNGKVWLFALATMCCRPRLVEVDRTEFGFGSYIRIRALAPNKALLNRTVEKAFAEMFRLDTLWSSFLPGSEVALLNRTGRAAVSSDTRELISEALRVCAATDGALDITVKPVLNAWGFTSAAPGGNEQDVTREQWRVPDSVELARARSLVDFRQVLVRGDSVLLLEDAQIDLGAVAVGFAVDRAVEMLQAAGVNQGLIDAGGDIRVFGDRDWKIGLKNPRGEGVIRVFRVRNRAVSTSGDYEKFFEADGHRYHHIIDPCTGYPADRCASVTILAPTAFAADAYATAVFVLGPNKGLEKVREQEGMAAVVLVDSGDSLKTYETGR